MCQHTLVQQHGDTLGTRNSPFCRQPRYLSNETLVPIQGGKCCKSILPTQKENVINMHDTGYLSTHFHNAFCSLFTLARENFLSFSAKNWYHNFDAFRWPGKHCKITWWVGPRRTTPGILRHLQEASPMSSVPKTLCSQKLLGHRQSWE